MPNIDVDGYLMGFYSDDVLRGEPIHVHVKHDRKDVKFWLEKPLREAYNRGYKKHELRHIRALIEDNRQAIIDLWEETKGKIL